MTLTSFQCTASSDLKVGIVPKSDGQETYAWHFCNNDGLFSPRKRTKKRKGKDEGVGGEPAAFNNEDASLATKIFHFHHILSLETVGKQSNMPELFVSYFISSVFFVTLLSPSSLPATRDF